MKSFVLFCTLGFFTFFSCEGQKANSKFNIYIDYFDHIDIPFIINQERIETLPEANSSTIDSLYIDLFIERNKEMGGGIFLYNLYNYFPIGYFKISEKYTGAVIEKNGGAGGIEKYFYLIIYNNNGDQLDKLLIAKAIGDCSFLNIRTSEINNEFKISIEDISFIGDCENEVYSIKENSKIIFFIEKGRIIEF